MPWFYVDDGFSDSKPVMSIPDRLVRVPMRLAVCGLWVLGGSWSAKEELDGFIPNSKLKSLRAPRPVIDAITGPGTLNAPLCDPKVDGIQVKNWQKWQPTKVEIEAKRKREAEKKRNQRRRGRNFVTGLDDQMSPGDNPGDTADSSEIVSPGESPSPNPTQPNPLPLVDLSGGVTQVAATGPRPECHEHSENYDGPCRKCKRRREWDEANKGVVAANEVARQRALKELRENCPRCGGNNTYEDETGVVRKCNPHVEAVRHA